MKQRSSSLTIVLLGAVLCTAIFAMIYAPVPLVDRMVERDIRAQAQLWEQRLLRNLENGARTFSTGTITTQDEEFMEVIPESSEIYRFKLFDATGLVIWSTRDSDIGTVNEKPYWSDQIAQGQVFFKSELKPSDEIDTFTGIPTEDQTHLVIEIYQPISVDGQFAGAIEFYSDITELHAVFLQRVQLVLGAAAGFVTLIFMLVLIVVTQTNRARLRTQETTARQERESLDKQLRLAKEVQLLGELNEWLQSSGSLTELFEMVSKFLEHLLPNCAGSIYVYSNSRDVLDGAAHWNKGHVKDYIKPTDCWGLRRGRTYKFGASDINFVCEHAEPHDNTPYFCFPILAHGETVGLMHLKSTCDEDHTTFFESQKLAQMCAEQISLAIANVRLRDELQDQSIRDPLTGLFNRRYIASVIKKAGSHAETSGTPFALISIDVDNFKKFNDTFGHDAGDIVLRSVGEIFAGAVDGDDVACRYGGEEFLIFLSGSDAKKAWKKAEEIRLAVNEMTVRYGEKTLPKIAISAGVSAAPEHGTDPQQLIRIADDALYEAKAQGRNLVVVAGDQQTELETSSIAAE